MPFQARGLIGPIRPFLSRQKSALTYRLWNPLKYAIELSKARFVNEPASSAADFTGRLRVVLVSDLDAPSSEQQFYPFSTYRRALRSRLRFHSVHLKLVDVLRAPRWILSHFDIVILKLSYRTDATEAIDIVRLFRNSIGHKKLLYFDGDDDICIQWKDMLSYVDLYVKKHAFLDRSRYLHKYIGKSNLHDYVHTKYNYVLTPRDYGNPWEKQLMISESGPIAPEHLDKIVVGADLAGDDVISFLYKKVRGAQENMTKDYDIIFRGSVTKGTIVYHLRGAIEPILREMEHDFCVIIPNQRVPRDEYYREMMRSKICVSPFGYGEICWRDYEAVLCRSLLIKPNMDHVETTPNIFQKYKTYVPVQWDFSDLREKCEYYLKNDKERQTIVENAYKVMDEFYNGDGFVKSISAIVKRLGDGVYRPDGE